MSRTISSIYISLPLITSFALFFADAAESGAQPTSGAAGNTSVSTVSASAAPDADDIRRSIAEMCTTALSEKGVERIVNWFCDADHERIQHSLPDKRDQLDQTAKTFQAAWVQKYGKAFDSTRFRSALTESFLRITQGEIGEAQQAGSRERGSSSGSTTRPLSENTGRGPSESDEVRPQAMTRPPNDGVAHTAEGRIAGADTNREPRRNIATATFWAADGRRELPIPLIHELPDQWKIDVPDNIDGLRMTEQLKSAVAAISTGQDKWPSDEADAYRMIAYQICVKLFGP